MDDIRAVWDTNVFGVIAVSQAMLPLLRRSPSPRIVNLGSTGGSLAWNATPDNAHAAMFGTYSASKTALHAVTFAFAMSLKADGIKVNAACPGFTKTALNNFKGTRTVEEGARSGGSAGPDRRRRPHRHVLRRGRPRRLVSATHPPRHTPHKETHHEQSAQNSPTTSRSMTRCRSSRSARSRCPHRIAAWTSRSASPRPVTGQNLPVILFSHGHGPSLYLPSADGYGPIVNFWAAHGFG